MTFFELLFFIMNCTIGYTIANQFSPFELSVNFVFFFLVGFMIIPILSKIFIEKNEK